MKAMRVTRRIARVRPGRPAVLIGLLGLDEVTDIRPQSRHQEQVCRKGQPNSGSQSELFALNAQNLLALQPDPLEYVR